LAWALEAEFITNMVHPWAGPHRASGNGFNDPELLDRRNRYSKRYTWLFARVHQLLTTKVEKCRKTIPQGLKPNAYYQAFAARLRLRQKVKQECHEAGNGRIRGSTRRRFCS
jgi:hypothetical protein